MDYQQKLSHINALVRLAKSDDVFSEIEVLFVNRIADRLGVRLEDLSAYDQKDLKLHLPHTEDEVIPLFHRLVILIAIDRIITPEERDLCFHLGVKMGLNPQAVSDVIDLIQEKGNDVDPSLIIEIFNRHNN